MKAKAQVSVEFIIVIIVLLSLFLFSIWIYSERQTGFIFARENYEAKLLADKIARTANNVYLAGNGAQARILLEKNVDFNVSFLGNAVQVAWRDNYIDSALLTDNVTVNSLALGQWVNVRNVAGGIVIENS